MTRLAYRADLDGLRAIAVALVVAFHFGLPGIRGGYIGVDLFFVISGFLIAAIVERAPAITPDWLLVFYGRRIKRLLPAFLVVAAVTTIAASVLMLPDDYEAFLKSVRASLMFRANGWFERATSGYFAANAHELPWLHTWSLSIEWQFYFVFPLVMLAVRRLPMGRPRLLALATLAAGTVVVSIAMVAASPAFAYFSAVARFFEFLVGALAASLGTPTVGPATRRIVVAGSLLALLAVAMIYTAATPFPGLAASLVCLLGAALIVVGEGSLLAAGWLTWIGRRSYAIYLWHWPVVAFLAYLQRPPSMLEAGGWIVAIVALADATHRGVERPGIALTWQPVRTFVLLCVLPLASVAGFYVFVRAHDGLPARLGDEAVHAEGNLRRFDFVDAERCHGRGDRDIETCTFGDRAATTQALMIGDSHARHLRPFVQGLAAEAHLKVYGLTDSECPTLEGGGGSPTPALRATCDAALVRDYALIRSGRFRYVMLAQRWIGYDAHTLAALDGSLATIVASGAIPILFNSPADDGIDTRACFFRHIKLRRPYAGDCDIARDNAFAQPAKAHAKALIDAMRRRHPTLIYIDPQAVQCHDDLCATVIDGTPIYADSHHLDAFGSATLGRLYRERFGNPFVSGTSAPRADDGSGSERVK